MKDKKYIKLLGSPLKNIIESPIQDGMRESADLAYRAGCKSVAIRLTNGECCEWCTSMAGIYDYPCDKEVFTRHDNCDCTVIVKTEKGIQNAHTKEFLEEKVYKDLLNNKMSTNTFLSRVAYEKARELGYNPIRSDKVVNILRKSESKWHELLTPAEIKSIEKYTYNSSNNANSMLYKKINNYLEGIYTPSNKEELETIIRNAKNMQSGILKSELTQDIIAYRSYEFTDKIDNEIKRFLSTSVVPSGVIGRKANAAIIVPAGTECAYIEHLSSFPKQRELIIAPGIKMKTLMEIYGLKIFEVVR